MQTFLRMLFFIIFVSQICFAQWEILNEGFRGSINTIDFVNDNIGWIAGRNGTFLKTTDGGENWNSIPINENWHINQIDFINETVGWAIASVFNSSECNDIIVKTDDGGYNWSIQKQILGCSLASLYAIDEINFYTIGENKIYKTSDGGENWVNVSPNIEDGIFSSLWFQNPDTGVVVGSYGNYDGNGRGIIIKTNDGGTTWDQNIVNEFNNITDLQFFDSKTGYFKAYKDTANFICTTKDMCSNWKVNIELPYPIVSYQFLDTATAYSIMLDSVFSTNIMKSIDGGYNWQIVQVLNFCLDHIYFFKHSTGIILGYFGGGRGEGPSILFHYTSNNECVIQKFSLPLNDIFFIDKNTGILSGGYYYLHGSSGGLFVTHDGGKTWDKNSDIEGVFQSSIFMNNLEGFVLASGSGIYKTYDGGDNWIPAFQNNFDSLFSFGANDICFMDENYGWAAGNYSVTDSSGAGILGTPDRGKSWELVWKYPSSNDIGYNLNSISFADATGWAVGESGIIVKYTPQTGWIKQTSVTDLPLKKVFFSDENNGWITGGYKNENDFQSILLKTINNGETWGNNKLDYLINDLWFVTNQHGWAVGSDKTDKGVILESKDGGDNWTVEVDNLIGPLNSIFIKDNYAWAVGDNGLILRTANTGVTWIDDTNDKVSPTEFQLESNYPNPFNPSTVINYQLPTASKVILKVYDVLGREIATLVNEEKSPGFYEVEFNCHSGEGRNLSSGIYFYRIQAGSFVSTKKMILLK